MLQIRHIQLVQLYFWVQIHASSYFNIYFICLVVSHLVTNRTRLGSHPPITTRAIPFLHPRRTADASDFSRLRLHPSEVFRLGLHPPEVFRLGPHPTGFKHSTCLCFPNSEDSCILYLRIYFQLEVRYYAILGK